MSSRSISERSATERGRLRCEFDAEFGLVTIRSRYLEPCPRGLNLDDLVILDADSEGTVLAIEIGVPEANWQVSAFPTLPYLAVEADLILEAGGADATDDAPLRFLTDPQHSQVLVIIGEWDAPPDRRIALSDSAGAFSLRGELVGILAILGRSTESPARV